MKEKVEGIIFEGLDFDERSREAMGRLIEACFDSGFGVGGKNIENIAGGILWAFSRINHLWEYERKWMRNSIAERLGVKSKTIGNRAVSIFDGLNVVIFDERFRCEGDARRGNYFGFRVDMHGRMVR